MTQAAIFMDGGLGNFSKGFGDRPVYVMYLGMFEDYIVDLFKIFTNTNQVTHGCQRGDILGFHGT